MQRSSRRGKPWLVALLVGAAPLGLAGCVDGAGAEASPSPVAVFDSDDEAVAAAVAVYERYLAINAAINADRGADPERVLDVSTNEYGTRLLAEYREMRAAEVFIVGTATLLSSRLVEIDHLRTRLDVGLCVDQSATRIINRAGEDVTPEGTEHSALLVTFQSSRRDGLLLDGSERWSDDAPC